jgi:hypothetical protein
MSPLLDRLTFSAPLHSRAAQNSRLKRWSCWRDSYCFHSLNKAMDQVAMDSTISNSKVADTMGELMEKSSFMRLFL